MSFNTKLPAHIQQAFDGWQNQDGISDLYKKDDDVISEQSFLAGYMASPAAGFEQMKAAFVEYLTRNEQRLGERFVAIRSPGFGKTSWTYGEMAEEVSSNDPHGLRLMLNMMNMAADLIRRDVDNPPATTPASPPDASAGPSGGA